MTSSNLSTRTNYSRSRMVNSGLLQKTPRGTSDTGQKTMSVSPSSVHRFLYSSLLSLGWISVCDTGQVGEIPFSWFFLLLQGPGYMGTNHGGPEYKNIYYSISVAQERGECQPQPLAPSSLAERGYVGFSLYNQSRVRFYFSMLLAPTTKSGMLLNIPQLHL